MVVGFLVADVVGTGLLTLPVATADGDDTDLLTAAFHATSTVCVTGLVTVDTATHWTGFGEGVLLALMQVGGLGVMTFASLLGLLVAGRLGLRSRLLLLAIVAEVRGDPDVTAAGRRIDPSTVRQALTVALLSLAFAATATVVVLHESDLDLDAVLFEAFSAFGTVGLSTGITAGLPR